MSYWFVECDPVANEHLSAALLEHGYGEPEKCIRKDNRSRIREVWNIPSGFVRKLRAAKRADDRKAYHQFRFFVADSFNGVLRSADFVEKTHKSANLKKMEEQISKLESRANAARHIS